MNTIDASGVVNRYLTAFYSGDLDAARSLVADRFSFTGPFIQTSDNASFFASAGRLLAVVRGHHLLRQWSDGDDVCSIFDLRLVTPVGAGSVLMAEWHRVREGWLTEARVVFDTAAFRALMPAR